MAVAAGVTFYALLALFPGVRGPRLDLRPVRRPRDDPGAPRRRLGRSARRGAGDHRRAGQAHRHEGRRHAGLRLPLRPRHLALERQRRHEGALRCAEHRLRRGGEAQLRQAERRVAPVHPRRDRLPPPGPRRGRRAAGRPRLRRSRQRHRMAALAGALADPSAPVVLAGLAVLYRYGPSRDKAEWRWVTPGGLGRPCCGSSPRCCSPGTWRTSAATTRPMARSARPSAS